MPDPREKRVELILQQMEELPTLPAVALRVLQVTGDDHSSAREVVQLISSDPALTTRMLQLIRRADAGVRTEVTSIERAVVLLGFDAVRAAVLAVSVFETFAGRRPCACGFPRRRAAGGRRPRRPAGSAGKSSGSTAWPSPASPNCWPRRW